MSGIAGILHFDGAPVEPGQIERMTDAMAYRGPDGIKHWVKGNVALGQCMLRTTPESLEETQPLTNEDESLVLVMDGRVDNWEELRSELLRRGAVLRARADAELVLRAYETWGKDCLVHIDGDFALVIWDARKQTAFCARDRMGSKPFHYHWDDQIFAFASDLHPLLAMPWVNEEPNEGMLAELLADVSYSRDETLWQGIMRLVAAHRMSVNANGPRPEQYWRPDLSATLAYRRDEDYIDHYRELFADAVRRMSRSHRALACEVSGGLDSSAVFCMAEHLRRTGRLLAPGIKGYTLAFNDDSEANELVYARAVGEYLGVPIQEIPPSIMPLEWYAERARTYRVFPGFPNGAMSNALHMQVAADGCRAVLSGQWGDAFLWGSRAYYAEELAKGNLPGLLESFRADATVVGAKQATSWLLRHGIFPLLPSASQRGLHRLVRKIRKTEVGESLYWLSPAMREVIEQRRKQYCPPYATKAPRIPQKNLLEILYDPFMSRAVELQERQDTDAGIEMRNPMGDPRLVQFAFSTPERLRVRGDTRKYIHVRAMHGYMPQSIVERKTKANFSMVIRGRLDGMKQILTDTLPKERLDWVSLEGMMRLYRLYEKNPEIGWPMWVLWGISSCDSVVNRSKKAPNSL